MKSKITGGGTTLLFTTKVLGKYMVKYYQCDETGFIQTEEPFWLDESYANAITALDLGLVSRNIEKAELTSGVIDSCFPDAGRFLDYGGGYGMFTRLMRDRGFDFSHYDIHCENLFSKQNAVEELPTVSDRQFELLTAWEVFEHLPEPLESVEEMFSAASMILFSTEVVPGWKLSTGLDWWYISPETGQHISFYTPAAFQYIAKRFSATYYTDCRCNHLFTREPLEACPFRATQSILARVRSFILRFETKTPSRTGLLQSDFNRELERLRATIAPCTND